MGDGFGIGASNVTLAVLPRDAFSSKVNPIISIAGGIGEGFGMGASDISEDFDDTAAGGMGDGFGMGASNIREDVGGTTAGGMGDGFGIGASYSRETRVRADIESCGCNVTARAAGGIGDGLGMGASKLGIGFASDRNCTWHLFKFESTPVVKFLAGKDREAAPRFIPNAANARAITDIFRLISY